MCSVILLFNAPTLYGFIPILRSINFLQKLKFVPFSDSDYRPYFVDHDAVEARRSDEKAMEQFKEHAERINAILREFVGNPKDPKNPPVMLEWGIDLYLAIATDFGYLDEGFDVSKEKVRIQSKLKYLL